MDLQALTDNFAIPDILAFSQNEAGLIRASVTTPACTAELYLHGAHLTHWQPTGHDPVLFLSDRSAFTPDKAIRGGVPIIFPWFGGRTATTSNPRTDGPSHGFARLSEWTLAFAGLSGDDLHLTLTLAPNDASRALGYDSFQLAYQVVLGPELRLQLVVSNPAYQPLQFEEALHTYLSVADAEQITLIGLSDTGFLDKTDEFKHKTQRETLLKLTSETDRAYLNTVTPINIDDAILKRRISVCKANSKSTVVWNPWSELSAKLADMSPDGWRSMVCVETANLGPNAVTLAPGAQHIMESHIFAQKFAPNVSTDITAPTPPK
ncbi:MAG: D-hexose-6-phosphate mutarotase, partial [Acidobacteria bacterium]|nr:D-hexose-6-phosphate mutarotase [Acidobacteriota bacterium]